VTISTAATYSASRSVARIMRSIASVAVVLTTQGAPVTAAQFTDVPIGLRQYLERLTGPDALSCNRPGAPGPLPPGVPSPLDETMTCVATAKQQQKAFFAYGNNGTLGDSWQVSGIAMDASGKGFIFWYDSSPCGGLGCPDRLTVSSCGNPMITGLGISLKLLCDPVPGARTFRSPRETSSQSPAGF
jgi:hypothetical protein